MRGNGTIPETVSLQVTKPPDLMRFGGFPVWGLFLARSHNQGAHGPVIQKELIDAYRNTAYRIDTPSGPLTIRIGETVPQLDALLEQHGVRSWAFITAWNPGSRQLPEPENLARHAELEHRIATLGLATLPGAGEDQSGSWHPEQSVLVLGIDRATARDLGREFGQNAIVVGTLSEPAELLLCTDGGEV